MIEAGGARRSWRSWLHCRLIGRGKLIVGGVLVGAGLLVCVGLWLAAGAAVGAAGGVGVFEEGGSKQSILT